jgi:hypothetical protein
MAARAVLWTWGADPWYHMEGSQLESCGGLARRPRRAGGRGLPRAVAGTRIATGAAAGQRPGGRGGRECAAHLEEMRRRWRRPGCCATRRSPPTALLPLLSERKGGEDAGFALRWLLANGRDEVGRRGGGQAIGADGPCRAGRAARFRPACNLAPARLPKLPHVLVAGQPSPAHSCTMDARIAEPRVLDAIGEMLAFSPLERALCRPRLPARAVHASRAWADSPGTCSKAWLTAGAAEQGGLGLRRAGALLGRRRDAPGGWRKLHPRLANRGRQRARGRLGLDVLAAMASDVALMLLHGIAQKVKSKPCRRRRRRKMEQLALAARAVTPKNWPTAWCPIWASTNPAACCWISARASSASASTST